MADFSGRKVSIGLAPEATRGTPTAAASWVQQLDADFFNKSDKIINESVVGVLNSGSASEVVRDWAEGKIDGKVLDKGFGYLLYAALGQVSSAANPDASGSVKDHTFTQSQSNTPKTFTVTRKDGNGDKQYALGTLKSLEITVVVGEFVQYSSEGVTRKGAVSSSTVAYALENEFKAKYATVKMAANVAGLGAATAIPVRSIKLKFTRKTNPYFVVGSNDPSDIFVEEFSTTGEMTLRYTDTTYEVAHFNNTIQALLIDLQNTDVTLGTSARPRLQLTLPRVTTTDFNLDQKRDAIVEQTIALRGLFDPGSGAEVTAVLTNQQASY